jgi:hypothetical protein
VTGLSAKQANGKTLKASIVADPAVPMSQAKEPPLICPLGMNVNSLQPTLTPSVVAPHNSAQASTELRC